MINQDDMVFQLWFIYSSYIFKARLLKSDYGEEGDEWMDGRQNWRKYKVKEKEGGKTIACGT